MDGEPSRTGSFITFEGPEGSGKSTQVARLAARLESQAIPVTVTREPGGTPAGERIRAVLLDPDIDSLRPETEALLFSAARTELVATVVRPALDAGRVVLCDRYADATLAYQGYGRGVPLPWLRQLNRTATSGVSPDLTVLLDLPVEEGLDRRRNDGDWNRIDAADLVFHQRVRDGYLELASMEPERWCVVPAGGTADEVAKRIAAVAMRLIGPRQRSPRVGHRGGFRQQ